MVSDESALADVLNKGGYQGIDLIRKASTPQIKDTLRKYTQEALDIGICGVPSYRIFRTSPDGSFVLAGGTIWGQDETAIVEDLISGWDEESCTVIANVGEEHLGEYRMTSRL
jgi:2-hydroxychromene-2-carboxylate isomerase